MPRRVPTTTIDVIGKLDCVPELAIGNYIESKQQNKYIKPPIWDSVADTVELNLIHTKREHDAMLLLQKESLESAKHQVITNELRTHRLQKTQANLRKKMVEANIFMRECEEKKHDAEKRVSSETRTHKRLQKNIEMQKNAITVLTQFRSTLKATIAEYDPYEEVMSEVVKRSDIFESHKDCMDRCDALMLTQVDIKDMNSLKLQEIQHIFERIKKITNDAALQIMGLKNEIAVLERSFNKANSKCLHWERILAKVKDSIIQNESEKESVYEGIRVMYKILCSRKGENPIFQRYEVEKQMDFIKSEMELIKAILKKCDSANTKDINKGSPLNSCY